MAELEPLNVSRLYRACTEEVLDFLTTAELPDLEDSFGQSRAHEAIRLGVDMARPGYNLFVLGEPGSGRHAIVRQLLAAKAATEPPPGDWCYINNFDDAHRPRALPLAAGHLVEDLKEDHTDLLNVLRFLDGVLQDVVETGEELREQPKGDGDPGSMLMSGSLSLQRYQVNLLVDHRASAEAPILFEDNPTYSNLLGRIDHVAHFGTLVTNFTMISAGALHRANGGYLVLDAHKVLTRPFAWDGLKRALKAGQIRIEPPGQLLGLGGTSVLEPEPIPLKVKVVLIGERIIYYLLREFDPEFEELFKIAADFESDVERSDAHTRLCAQLIGMLGRRHELRPIERGAVARIIEHSARRAGDAEKLSTGTRWMTDLMCEADHCAAQAGSAAVKRSHVEQALAAQIRRVDRVRGSIHDAVLGGTLLIAPSGNHVGQVNALAVIDQGDFMFGHPVRITATVRLGDGEVIDIEREAELGGAIHSKGVMILSAFLATRYAHNMPLSLTASLVFEQSYGPVEGDSASLAELCALLSALSQVPIRQSLAMTGSVNQYGRVQAIGGVNEKIEGFFDGVPAGEADEEGSVPPGSINYLVAAQLAEMSALRQEFGATRGRKRARENKG